MKSLWKISRRYIWSAIIITVLVLYANFAVFIYFGIRNMGGLRADGMGRDVMAEIGEQIVEEDGTYRLSDTGNALLAGSGFLWAMLLDERGDVVWDYKKPPELPGHYSIGDVAGFSRWYLHDYPVRVWRNGDGLMVYGMEKESAVQVSITYDMQIISALPGQIKLTLTVNLILLALLSLFFGYRFYRSIRPLAQGIEKLAAKQAVNIPERGLTGELAGSLNKASRLLLEQDEKLKKRDLARTEWIAGVSHDIRTPLALISGYADELAASPALYEEQRKRAVQIQSLSILIGQLISDLNLTSKLEYQSQPLRRCEFSPAGLIRECVAEYYNQGLPGTYEIALEIDCATEAYWMSGDTGLLLRAFRNLIGNSIRHNPDGCTVTVRLNVDKNSHLFPDACAQLIYTFRDSGAGIPPEVAAYMEEKDGVNEDAAAEKSPIHVMGLRIAAQIVRAHGWGFMLVPRENFYCDVQICLPVKEEQV